MLYSYDTLTTFLPKNKPNAVILGTMCSAVIRQKFETKIENIESIEDKKIFYYHDNRNKFWKAIQSVFDKSVPQRLDVPERRDLAEKHGLAFMNLVEHLYVEKEFADKSSDDILFSVFQNNKKDLQFKKIKEDAKKVLDEADNIFFTCNEKPEIVNFLENYFEYNGMSKNLWKKIDFLCSPVAQCSVQTVCDRWLSSEKLRKLVSN